MIEESGQAQQGAVVPVQRLTSDSESRGLELSDSPDISDVTLEPVTSFPTTPGPVMLDRLVGWAIVTLTACMIPIGIAIAPKGYGTFLERYGLLGFTFVGALAITRSARSGFLFSVGCFVVRGVFDTMRLASHPSDRYASMTWVFDLMIIGYAVMRIRALSQDPSA